VAQALSTKRDSALLTYILRRILLMIPTFVGITLVSFLVINLAPGGPIEQRIQAIRFGGASLEGGGGGGGKSSGTAGINQEILDALNKQYGFDKPVLTRYWIWLTNISKLDFGESFTYQQPAFDVIASKFPVSLQFGIASLIFTYLVCIPLGIAKAVKAGTSFDFLSGVVLYIAYSIPPLVLGIFLIVFFAGGRYFSWFPLGQLYSDGYDSLPFVQQVIDRVHHFILPLICYMIGSFTVLTMLMKNSLLDEVKKDYIRTARAKGVSEKMIYLKHALRNALIPIVTGIGGFISVFFAGSLNFKMIF
jgi:microcin C transport system permease protein